MFSPRSKTNKVMASIQRNTLLKSINLITLEYSILAIHNLHHGFKQLVLQSQA